MILKKPWAALLAVLLLAAVVLGIMMLTGWRPFSAVEEPKPTAAPTAESTEVPTDVPTEAPTSAPADEVTANATAEPGEAPTDVPPAPAKAYVLATAGSEYYWLPLPEEEEYSVTARQVNPENGEEWTNVITVTTDGVYMRESNCDNQDCVGEGTITLENREERILGNMIVCLPHQVMLQLYTPEEIIALYAKPIEEDAE